jgi:hypothetical protein
MEAVGWGKILRIATSLKTGFLQFAFRFFEEASFLVSVMLNTTGTNAQEKPALVFEKQLCL